MRTASCASTDPKLDLIGAVAGIVQRGWVAWEFGQAEAAVPGLEAVCTDLEKRPSSIRSSALAKSTS
jgi:hypothetical protein